MPEKRGKILVIRGGAIGDFILTLPAIAALRGTFPECHLEVLGYPHMAALTLRAGIIDSYKSIEARALAGYFARVGTLDPGLSSHFASMNMIISYLYDPDDFFKSNIARSSQAQFIQGPHRPSEHEDIHATAVFLQPLERLAIFDADPIPRLVWPRTNFDSKSLRLAVHPGSGSEKKNWPISKWIQLLNRLVGETKWNILVVGGEADLERLATLRSHLLSDRIQYLQNTSLMDTTESLAQCHAFLGHDSGITHLACALDLPSLVLWGPSKEEIWRPLSPRARLLKFKAGLADLPEDVVYAQLLNLLKPLENK